MMRALDSDQCMRRMPVVLLTYVPSKTIDVREFRRNGEAYLIRAQRRRMEFCGLGFICDISIVCCG